MRLLLFIFLFFHTGQLLAAQEMIVCGKNRSKFKQMCRLKENVMHQSIQIKPKMVHNNRELEFTESLSNGSVEILEASETTVLELPSLSPVLNFSAEFSGREACTVSQLWQDNLGVQVITDEGEKFLGKLRQGKADYALELSSAKGSYTFSGGTLSSSFRFKNSSDRPGRSPATKRIPLDCGLKLSSVYIGFDPASAPHDLKFLKVLASQSAKVAASNFVIDGLYLEQEKGVRCSIKRLADTLLRIELNEWSDFDELSEDSKTAISAAVTQGRDLGVIDLDDLKPWELFMSEAFQESLTSCHLSHSDHINLSSERYTKEGVITNRLAYQNALSYEREVQNIKSLLEASWAIVKANNIDVENIEEYKWLVDPFLYTFLKEKQK